VIRTETSGGVREIVLDRPDRRNALTPEMLVDLERAVREASAERADAGGVRAVLLRGEGRVFCAGFDLDLCRDDGPEQGVMRAFLEGLSAVIVAMRASPRPVVLAAHGAAIAGGCALLGGADVVVSDRDAKLGYPVVRLGISPAVSAPFLIDSVGIGPARRRLLDPELFDGAEGARLGLVHELVEAREDVVDRARAIAGSLAEKSPAALKATKGWAMEVAGEAKMSGKAARALDASVSLITGGEARERLAGVWKK